MILKKGKWLLLSLITLSCAITIINLLKEEREEVFYLEEINTKIESGSYYAILAIPEINLKRELFPINDEQNDVNINLFITSNSTFPDNNESNLIIAGHSGTGSNAYFANLYKLDINNEIYLYYNEHEYTYVIREIEFQDKTGILYLKNEYPEMLTLITCTEGDNNTQTIYYAELQNM